MAGASGLRVPSPLRLLAEPPLCRYQGVYSVRARGHSCSSRQRFSPITKMRTGASSMIPVSSPLSQWPNQRFWISMKSISASGPKSRSPQPSLVGRE